MIRRDAPRSADAAHWLLIHQREHARLSYELAAAWGGGPVAPLLGDLPATRRELLQAIRLHDEGWAAWEAAPAIDPDLGRPYGFTEMPPADAQRLWTHSIEACRAVGPLAGWIAAGHFVHLQSKQDQDYVQWKPWLAQQQTLQAAWLAEWRQQSPDHTLEVATRSLFLLQTFDWLSLWLCCRAPLVEGDPDESLDLGDAELSFGPFQLHATRARVAVSPWPFGVPELNLRVDAIRVPTGWYTAATQLLSAGEPVTRCWRLAKPA